MTDRSSAAWRREMFERYAGARREARIPHYRLEALADLTRHLPEGTDDEAVLSFARFHPDAADRRVSEELEHLGNRGWAAEWKVHDFDEPRDLRARLEARGLACQDAEALMVLEVARAPVKAGKQHDARVEAATGGTLEEIVTLQEEIWKCRLPWLAGVLHEMTDPVRGSGLVFCVRAGGRVVGAAWIDFHGGSEFAQLSGGSVAGEHRGRGIYSLLFERRLEEARARAVPFLAVDAAPMSRPILERKGFSYLCGTYPLRTRAMGSGAVTRS